MGILHKNFRLFLTCIIIVVIIDMCILNILYCINVSWRKITHEVVTYQDKKNFRMSNVINVITDQVRWHGRRVPLLIAMEGENEAHGKALKQHWARRMVLMVVN